MSTKTSCGHFIAAANYVRVGMNAKREGSCRIHREENARSTHWSGQRSWRFRAQDLFPLPLQVSSLAPASAHRAPERACFAVPAGNSSYADHHRPGRPKPLPALPQAPSCVVPDSTAVLQPFAHLPNSEARSDDARGAQTVRPACPRPFHALEACVRCAWRASAPSSFRPTPQ